jgi:hypothetical protein
VLLAEKPMDSMLTQSHSVFAPQIFQATGLTGRDAALFGMMTTFVAGMIHAKQLT